MKYVAVYANERVGPVDWARAREAEGWSGLAVADHVNAGRGGVWHPFAALGAMAATTSHVKLTTAYANNLMRSPVECAQAALSLQELSAGRFELGLGAGWARDEIVAAGLPYPSTRERAERFREATVIIRDLLRGPCQHEGAHYRVDLVTAGPTVSSPPLLAAALGGPWTIKHIAPLIDRVEINPAGAAIRGGALDFAMLAATTSDQVKALIANARRANPSAPVGMGMFVAVGKGPVVEAINERFGDGIASGMAGSAELVASKVVALAEYGVEQVTLVPLVPGSLELLAPALLG